MESNNPRMPMVVEFIKSSGEIRPIGVQFCCLDMASHYRSGIVAFGSRPEETSSNKLAEVFIRVDKGAQVVCLTILPTLPEVEARATAKRQLKPNTDIAIPYCPWCTAPVLVREIDLTPRQYFPKGD